MSKGQAPHTRTHYIKHKKKKRKNASRKRKKQKKPKYASRNGGIRVANMRSLFCHASRIDREDSDAEEKAIVRMRISQKKKKKIKHGNGN